MMIRKIKSNNLSSSPIGLNLDVTNKDSKFQRADRSHKTKTGFNLNRTITSDLPEIERQELTINHR